MDGTSTDVNLELDSSSHDANVDTSFSPDIFDPRYWDSLDPRQVDIFAKKGPKRDLSIKKGPKDRYSRRFIVAIVIYRRIDILGEFEFIVAIVIWYEVLYAVNLVSKHLQAKDMLIDIAIEKVEGLISFFKNYRETGFLEALETAKGIALKMDIGTTFVRNE